ncbi:MAG: nucleoside deaminase [Bacteroidia bacterium]|nr:nucleoside deaminase [Bacteroidia bacterium]MCO5255069.1 nucleoside deaminase [Bacteroidota bacterium]MCZ2129827.1 nucleoside deaminase [Bacteroidia bacterium]
MENILSDEYFMEIALKEAQKAFDDDEVPIGAVIVHENKIIGKGYNQTEKLKDITAHAEMIAITAASGYIGSKYLEECTMYVTLEPCVMCMGALKASRITKVVFGASEPKTGFSVFLPSQFANKINIVGNIKQQECALLMQDFFKNKR